MFRGLVIVAIKEHLLGSLVSCLIAHQTQPSLDAGAAGLICGGIVDMADFSILAEQWLRSL